MLNPIVSQDVRSYMERTDFTFADRDLATVLFHAGLPMPELHRALEALAEKTPDAALRRQIRERLTYDRQSVARFCENDGSCCYAVFSAPEDRPLGYFTSAQAALAAGKAEAVPFEIQKHPLRGPGQEAPVLPAVCRNPRLFPDAPVQQAPCPGAPVAVCRYDATGALCTYRTCEMPPEDTARVEDWGARRFEDRFVALPNPFQRGDLVHLAEEPDTWGVVETSREEWARTVDAAQNGSQVMDFCDGALQVEFLTEEGTFTQEHIAPIALEFLVPPADDPRQTVLQTASGLLTGKCSLDFFLTAYCDYRRPAGHRL